ncbi:hypothetical protein ABS71_03015 [bacterium SCN 62-11]|nr:hypothetical protein [Candidatus Eremiobacteraeota bacterium]ODT76738.1 MAG: hypothetical protein ABS71_03015 [bacterium SCN 62-11]
MSYLSCIDELSNPWLCQQALTDQLVVEIRQLRGNQEMAQKLEQNWLQVVGIHRASACATSGKLRLSYDLRRFSRSQLKARVTAGA